MADPHTLSETIAKISVLLAQLVDPIFDAELSYKQSRAKKYDDLLKKGEKKSPAAEAMRFDPELIKMENDVERIRNFIKRTEQIISTTQTHIRVQSGIARNEL